MARVAFAQNVVPAMQRDTKSAPMVSDISTVTAQLGTPTGQFAAAQLALMADAGRNALILAAASADPLVKIDCASGLGMIGDSASVSALVQLFKDNNVQVNTEALHSLYNAGSLGKSALVKLATSGPRSSAGVAVVALYHYRDWSELLGQIARNPASSGRYFALKYYFGKDEAEVMATAMRDPRFAVRYMAAYRLARAPRKHTETLDRIAKLGTDKQREILAYFDNFNEELPPPYFLLLMRDRKPLIRARANFWYVSDFLRLNTMGNVEERLRHKTDLRAILDLLSDKDRVVAKLITGELERVASYSLDQENLGQDIRAICSAEDYRFLMAKLTEYKAKAAINYFSTSASRMSS